MPLTLERRRKEDKEDKKKEKEKRKEEKKEKKKYKTKNEEYMDKKIDELTRQLQEEKQNTRREKLTVARLQRELSKSKSETPSRETLMKDLTKERELRLEAENRLQEVTTESETCKDRLKSLQSEFDKMEDAVSNMLQYKSKVEQLKMEKSNVILAYENNLQKYRSHISNLEKDNSSLMNEFQNMESVEENRKEKSLLVERLRALEAENSALVLENENQRDQYERCLDEVANQVVQALLMQKDLRAECIKLQNRVFDLEQQNKMLNVMFERERQRHSNREPSMQTHPSKRSRERCGSSEANSQTAKDENSIKSPITPTTSQTAQALYRAPGATGSNNSSPSNQKRKPNSKPTGSRQPPSPLLRNDSSNSNEYTAHSSESLHSNHSNHNTYAYPNLPTMPLGWSPPTRHKPFLNGELYHSQSDFSLPRNAHSLDRYGNGYRGNYMKETSAMIDMFAHYGRPDRLYTQYNGAQQELAEERMYQASAFRNGVPGENSKIPHYSEFGGSELPAKLRETFRQFHEESLHTEHMMTSQHMNFHPFLKSDAQADLIRGRRDFMSSKPMYDNVSSRNGLIVADKYHLPFKHAPYETAQSVLKELNDASANVTSFESLTASDSRQCRTRRKHGSRNPETAPRLDKGSHKESFESVESEDCAQMRELLDSMNSLNSIESIDDNKQNVEIFHSSAESGERINIVKIASDNSKQLSPRLTSKSNQHRQPNGAVTETKEINRPNSQKRNGMNDLTEVKGESSGPIGESSGTISSKNDCNKPSTYSSPWRRDTTAALNISHDIPTRDYSSQSAFVQYTSVSRNDAGLKSSVGTSQTSQNNNVKEKTSEIKVIDVNSSVNVKGATTQSRTGPPTKPKPVKAGAVKSQMETTQQVQKQQGKITEKSVKDSDASKKISQTKKDSSDQVDVHVTSSEPVKKGILKKSSPPEKVEVYIPSQSMRLLEEESDDSLYHSTVNMDLVAFMKQRTEGRGSEVKGHSGKVTNCTSTTSGNNRKDINGCQATQIMQHTQKYSEVPLTLTNGSSGVPSKVKDIKETPELVKQISLNECVRNGKDEGLSEDEKKHLYRRLSSENRMPSFISPEKLSLMKKEAALAQEAGNSSGVTINPDERPIRPYYANKPDRIPHGDPGTFSRDDSKKTRNPSHPGDISGKPLEESCVATKIDKPNAINGTSSEKSVEAIPPLSPGKCLKRKSDSNHEDFSHARKVPTPEQSPKAQDDDSKVAAHVAKKPGRTRSESSLEARISSSGAFQFSSPEKRDPEYQFASEDAFKVECIATEQTAKDLELLNLSPRLALKSAPLRRSPCQILTNGVMEEQEDTEKGDNNTTEETEPGPSIQHGRLSGNVSMESLNSINSLESIGSATVSLKSSISKKSATPLSEFLSDSEDEEEEALVNFVDMWKNRSMTESKIPVWNPSKTAGATQHRVQSHHGEVGQVNGKHSQTKLDFSGAQCTSSSQESSRQYLNTSQRTSSPQTNGERTPTQNCHGITNCEGSSNCMSNGVNDMDRLSPIIDGGCADKNGKVLWEESSEDPSEIKDLGTEKFSQNDPKHVKENFNATSAKIEEIRKNKIPVKTIVDETEAPKRPTTLFLPTKTSTSRPCHYQRIVKGSRENGAVISKYDTQCLANSGLCQQPIVVKASSSVHHRIVGIGSNSFIGVKTQQKSMFLDQNNTGHEKSKKNEPRPTFIRSVYHECQNTKPQLGAVSTSHFAMKSDDVPFMDDSSSGQDSDTLKTPDDLAKLEKQNVQVRTVVVDQHRDKIDTRQLRTSVPMPNTRDFKKSNRFGQQIKHPVQKEEKMCVVDKQTQSITYKAYDSPVPIHSQKVTAQCVTSKETSKCIEHKATQQALEIHTYIPPQPIKRAPTHNKPTQLNSLHISRDHIKPTPVVEKKPERRKPENKIEKKKSEEDKRAKVDSKAPIISADLMEDFEGSDLYDSDDIESAGEESAQLDAHERANLLDSFFESDSDDSFGDSDDTDDSHPGEDAFLRLLGDRSNKRQVLRYSESNRTSILEFNVQELYTRFEEKEREAMSCFDFLDDLVDEIGLDFTENNENPFMDTNQNSQTEGDSGKDFPSDDEGMQQERRSDGSSSPERLSLSDSLYDSYSSSSHSLCSNH